MYHWLLMGDYAFNRQTEIDDANDVKTMLNSSTNGSGSTCNNSNSGSGNSNNINTIKEHKKEVVSNNELLVKVGKKSNPSSSDVGGASTSGRTASIASGGGNQYIDGVDAEADALHADDMETIEKFLEKLNININTELMLAKRTRVSRHTASSTYKSQYNDDYYSTLNEMDYYKLYDVWNPGFQYGGELNISAIGNFTLMYGLQLVDWYKLSSTITRRMNMHLARVRCLVVIIHKNGSDTLEHYLTTRYDTHLDSMNRFNVALLSNVRDLFNFSFILSKTSTWGYLKNGKFDGMIGALVRKQADIGGSPIFFRTERAKVIDYTTHTWVASEEILFIKALPDMHPTVTVISGFPKNDFSGNREQRNATTKERSLVSIFKFLFTSCGRNINGKKQKGRVDVLLESFLFYMGSICQQGLSFSTHFFSGRCIVVASLMFSFAIYQFYSASIVGTLLMEKPKTIRTLRDLVHSSLEIGIEDIAYNRDYFLRTKDPVAQELYANKVTSVPSSEKGFADTPLDGVQPTAAVALSDAAKAKAYRDILHSHETGAHSKVSEASNWYEPDFGVNKIRNGRKGFAFHVDVATAYKIIADTFTEKEICDLTEIQLFPPQKMVDMQTFTSALLVLIFGYAVSLLILGLEIMYHKLWQRYATT
uniref:Ionotropic glutamate receptor C-terminal domain-containing protein n=1 Tax=Glossina brevipalpis TaxID=37001 RepID=A0A1A9WAA6_9MUSC